MLLNNIKNFIKILFKLLPHRVNNLLTNILLECRKEYAYTKKELQANLNIFGFKFVLQLPNKKLFVDSYIENSKNGVIYEEPMVFCLKSLLGKMDDIVFFDIGACAGYYSSFVSTMTDKKTIVYAIESNSEYCKSIEESNILNKQNNIFVKNAVLSHKTEDLLVHHLMTVNKEYLVSTRNDYQEIYEEIDTDNILKNGQIATSIKLDDLCKNNNIYPNIIKIDVHGAEGNVLLGSKNVLKESINYILLELHQQQILSRYSEGMTRFDIMDYLLDLKFQLYIISPFRGSHRLYEYKEYKKSNKLFYLRINRNNYKEVMFDRNLTDVFMLCVKEGIDINNHDCF